VSLIPVEMTPRFRRKYRKKTADMRAVVDEAVVLLRRDLGACGRHAGEHALA
jgi:hypothetical protein